MPTYEVYNEESGESLWTGEAASKADALDQMSRAAGHLSHAEACLQSGDDGKHLIVTEI